MTEWRKLLADPQTVKCINDQCATDLRDSPTDHYYQKRTQFVASSECLAHPLRSFQCPGVSGAHVHMQPGGAIQGNRHSQHAQEWTTSKLCSAVVEGITECVQMQEDESSS